MNTTRHKPGEIGKWVFLIGLAAGCAWGDLVSPLYVGNTHPVLDPFGRPLKREAVVSRSPLVEIRRTLPGGVIYPPSKTGESHPMHTLIQSGRMGDNALDSRTFCVILTEALPEDALVFARVYNAPTAAEATFYADSQPIRAPAHGSDVVLSFRAIQPMDGEDASGNGLGNSFEAALQELARSGVDSDEDGSTDYAEYRAGTDLMKADSLLAFTRIEGEAGADVRLRAPQEKQIQVAWQSIPGKSYRLEYVRHLLPAEADRAVDWQIVGEVTAEAGEYEIVLNVVQEESDELRQGTFRLRLMP
ncbi:MAG: hypothetical protein LBN38_04855 [Verrucomicrobiota bacterium]|jgi:hypothetical protein|nr:hypothetical protein [Verrucomicrobiota bacterium]